jgi:hypothetical protein
VTVRARPGRIVGMTAAFIPGLQLAEAFYDEAVRPLLDQAFPRLPYAAALLGAGSEVLGYDTERSTDHDWGPRLLILLSGGGPDEVTAKLARRLPPAFRGYPTAFPVTREPGGQARHRVEVADVATWLAGQLGFDPRPPIAAADWLTVPTQRLAEITAGTVFHDGPGELSQARARLAWYPRDVWRYVLARQWQRIAQEEAFPGRCAEVGDELGSAVVTARLARDLMRLGLLMGRRYPPYSKWLGTAFARLPDAPALAPHLAAAIAATNWPARERHLGQAYRAAAGLHNGLGLTPALSTRTRRYYNRPYRVINAGRFSEALLDAIADPQVRQLPGVGAVDEFIDSTDALGHIGLLRAAIAAASGAGQARA